ncbi:MAG: sodium:solute symporter family transporter [Candidatus Latescibacterota bacterium]
METQVDFGWINWTILIGALAAITVAGHLLRGRNATMRDFFLGGRNIPWWAVSGSIIATQTSALTFIAVPAAVFMKGGNLTYLQMTFGFILGNILMALIFVKPYYDKEIYSPYDFIGNRLGVRASQLARFLFIGGAIMSQGVRLLSTGLILSVVTGLSLSACIFIIFAFSVIWTLSGGIKTVIWTDVIQAAIFIFGAIFCLFWTVQMIPGPISEILSIADNQARLVLFDLSTDPRKTYTLWVGLLGSSIFQLGQNAIDQVSTQRIMCCRNHREAQKAVIFASAGSLLSFIMLAVGVALVAFYTLNPLPESMAGLVAKEPDRIFPYFIVTQIPQGVSGLMILSLFAAGISTLDSALAALSQTFIAGVYRPYIRKEASERHYLRVSRVAIVLGGLCLALIALGFHSFAGKGLLQLGFIAPGFVYGALLGLSLLALLGRGTWRTIVIGTACSIASVLALQQAGVTFFWWYPAAALVLVTVTLALSGLSSKAEKAGLPTE